MLSKVTDKREANYLLPINIESEAVRLIKVPVEVLQAHAIPNNNTFSKNFLATTSCM